MFPFSHTTLFTVLYKHSKMKATLRCEQSMEEEKKKHQTMITHSCVMSMHTLKVTTTEKIEIEEELNQSNDSEHKNAVF